MNKFVFRNQEISCNKYYISNALIFEFGEGEFIDTNGDNFFIHCEYNGSEFKFLIYFENVVINTDENYLSSNEKEQIKEYIKMLYKNK